MTRTKYPKPVCAVRPNHYPKCYRDVATTRELQLAGKLTMRIQLCEYHEGFFDALK